MTAVLRKGQLTYLNRLQSVCLLFNHSGAEVLQEIVSVQPDCAKEETCQTCSNCLTQGVHPESTMGVYNLT